MIYQHINGYVAMLPQFRDGSPARDHVHMRAIMCARGKRGNMATICLNLT